MTQGLNMKVPWLVFGVVVTNNFNLAIFAGFLFSLFFDTMKLYMLNTHFFRLLLGFIIIILIGIFSLLGISASEKIQSDNTTGDASSTRFDL